MNSLEQKAPITLAHEKAEQWRGYFLNRSAQLEHVLAVSLSFFFCPDDSRRLLFLSDIGTKAFFSFRHKVNLLARIARRNYPKHEFNPPTIFQDLEKIMEYRNIFAHSALHHDAAKSIGGLCFLYFEDGAKKEKFIDDAAFENMKVIIGACRESILGMREIFKSTPPPTE